MSVTRPPRFGRGVRQQELVASSVRHDSRRRSLIFMYSYFKMRKTTFREMSETHGSGHIPAVGQLWVRAVVFAADTTL